MILDHPEITLRLFYPRREYGEKVSGNSRSILVPVDEGINIGGYLHEGVPEEAQIVFFHGNGEIAADYDDIAPFFAERGYSFFVFDYRGYGRSDGYPTVTNMLKDAHRIFAWIEERRKNLSPRRPLIVMGRSLGSAPALELASHYPHEIDGLIIESGFAQTGPLLQLLGLDLEKIGFREEEGLQHKKKIAAFPKPTLIIHAEHDSLIPIAEGKMLYEASRAPVKSFTTIPNADHNTIFAQGLELYLSSVEWLVGKTWKGG